MQGPSVLGSYMVYFSQLTHDIKKALSAGWTLEETLQRTPMDDAFRLPAADPRAPLMEGRHSYNVQRTYLALSGK